ncbi:uncharacterized protein PV09_00368 [Verruconis gallopava]|uniref:GPI ethanolamine phosphate transferase 2 n=1 Tax=Verruconis gallopava TaxID=253628 RepID=A0A0D2ASN1_9PEZI|nr:uncharacterized protein PV09_00368 [Verruconis gallopava]KIW09490.1 hypothetical protein PV09_00368 [Verruconis gallopava]
MPAPSGITTVQYALLIVANLLIPIAVLTFATGFFPYKPFISGLAEYEPIAYGKPPSAQFDKLIFMVVDALRSDFVYGHDSGFKFTQSLIRSGEALPFTAHATSPTITMPRVKAITTGSIPSFLDVILNFAESDTTSTLASQDTWLAQIKDKKDGKLVMYGDDTWLKLFPNMFGRADGTSSFFVSDFTEVDNNVTRHVPHELRVDDWNAMIMHYLGLDHIGHKSGPKSPNMVPKQEEMDSIVKEIYEAMTSMNHLTSTLLVLCGDHGMNDGGNHGGSSPGETSPALVFISPKLKQLSMGKPCPTDPRVDFEYYKMIEQSDVAPTIAGLLGVPVPLNNLGVIIPDFLPLWSNRIDQVQLLLRNAKQILNIVKATFKDVAFVSENEQQAANRQLSQSGGEGPKLSKLWANAVKKLPFGECMDSDAYDAVEALYEFCQEAQELMSSAASNYDLSRLAFGIIVACMSVAMTALVSRLLPLMNSTGAFFALMNVLYAIMMFASSYVEEEQHFWYWITGAWISFLCCVRLQNATTRPAGMRLLIILAFHRVAQRWNQTGQKFAGAPDIAQNILRPNAAILWLLVTMTYLMLLYRIGNHIVHDLKTGPALGTACSLAQVVPAYLFKLGFTANDAPELLSWLGDDNVRLLEQIPLVGSARLIFLTLASETLWAFTAASNSTMPKAAKRQLPKMLVSLLTLFLITQSRTTNIPLFLLSTIQLELLSDLQLSPLQITITALVMGQTYFFALGNSNAISSIDLSNAYNGISGYSVIAVGILVFLGNWAGPVWWSVSGILLLVQSTVPEPIDMNTSAEEKRKRWVQMEMDNLIPNKSEFAAPEEADAMQRRSVFFLHTTVLTLFTSVSLMAVMIACTVLRTHLFIWTVFSPKYLFTMSWTLAFHLIVSVGLGGSIWQFCTK